MSRKMNCVFALLVLGVFLLAGCTGQPKAPLATATPVSATSAVQKPAWEMEWEKVKQAAKQEGKAVVYTDMGSSLRDKMAEAFARNYGVRLEFIAGRPAEFASRVLAEFRAGINTGDVYESGVTTALVTLKPAGVLETLDSSLLLPEVTDTKAWWGGKIPFTDKDHTHIGFLMTVLPQITINTDLVKPEELKSYRDLLNPKWKGKIVLNDPSIGGMGLGSFVALAEMIMDADFLRELGKQDLEINRDNRLQIEWVARGKYPIGIFLKPEEVLNFIRAGAPVKYVIPREGTHVSTSTGGISLFKNAPHPNAAKLFINWLLTREGQTLFSLEHGGQSAREDVPFDHVIPEYRREPGMKYWIDSSEEAAMLKEKYMKITKDMWGHLLK